MTTEPGEASRVPPRPWGRLPPRLAVQGSHLLISTVNGFTLDETGVDNAADGAEADDAEGDDGAGAADLASASIGALPAQRFPNLVALAAEFACADPGERFELLIDVFVDGLARIAGQS
jgi:hypothetical protein